jgi:hypothetical protein
MKSKDCALALMAGRGELPKEVLGSVIKNAESADNILAGMGRCAVVEGKVLSVRQVGAITYLHFGPSPTRGVTVTISWRELSAFASTGITLKSLKNRRIWVRD